jgi:hypothetical protein
MTCSVHPVPAQGMAQLRYSALIRFIGYQSYNFGGLWTAYGVESCP